MKTEHNKALAIMPPSKINITTYDKELKEYFTFG
jgi:hypothetical protein